MRHNRKLTEKRHLTVDDLPQLRREIRRGIMAHGDRTKAARALISPHDHAKADTKAVALWRVHLHRLEHAKNLRRISEATFDKLCTLVGPQRAPFLRRAIVSRDADRLLRQHGRWLWREVRPLLRAYAPASSAAGLRLIDGIEQELREIRPRAARKWKRAVDKILGPDRRMATADGYWRLLLAVRRIREPLECDASGIERTRNDLTPKELACVLEAGVIRECILLDRPLALERAQEIAATRDRSAKRWRLEDEEMRAKNRSELERIGVAEWNRRLESSKRSTRP